MNQPTDASQDYDAADLLEHFDNSIAKAPSSDSSLAEFKLGAKYTRQWRALRTQDSLSQRDFDELISGIEETETAGSAYAHLWVTVRNWGYELGFVVPRTPPPRLVGYGKTAICMSHAGFEQQIEIGTTYDVLEIDRERMLVRVANKNHQDQWYPCRDFQFPAIPERLYVRSPDW